MTEYSQGVCQDGAPKRIMRVEFPGDDGDPVFADYVRSDIADDLMEALEELLGHVSSVQVGSVYDEARALLAKAKGES